MRYAIYFLPQPDSALWRKASAWLGYDAITGAEVKPLTVLGIDGGLHAGLTADPRTYGFHATLKAPFRLAEGKSESELLAHAAGAASSLRAIKSFPLEVARISGFFALVPSNSRDAINALAGECVRVFDSFRAPMNAQEREKRLRSALTARQIELMDAWGYPYVFEEFRFHMTLTGAAPEDSRSKINDALLDLFAEEDRIASLDSICICQQIKAGQPFRMLQRFALAGD